MNESNQYYPIKLLDYRVNDKITYIYNVYIMKNDQIKVCDCPGTIQYYEKLGILKIWKCYDLHNFKRYVKIANKKVMM